VGGYASYIVGGRLCYPAATSWIGAAMLTHGVGDRRRSICRRARPRHRHLTIYLPAIALYLIVLPRIYGFSTLGNLPQFRARHRLLLATSFMEQAIGAWFPAENATLILLAPAWLSSSPPASHGRRAIPDAAIAWVGCSPPTPRLTPRAHQPTRCQHLGGRA